MNAMTTNDSRPGNTQKLFFHRQARKDMFWHAPEKRIPYYALSVSISRFENQGPAICVPGVSKKFYFVLMYGVGV